MYIYFDENGTIKEVVNDKSIRQGSNEANKLYCYIEGNPSIDDIWYLQKNVDGSLTNEISFKNSTITKAIPYDAKRDMRYFKDFETYTFYVFTLTTNYLKQSGLVSGTIRIEVYNEIFALGELKFNVQENVINTSNGITQSQYDYLLLAYASRTLNEQTGSDLDHLLDEKIDAKIGDIADGSPKVFDTTTHIQALTSDMGLAVATDTGYIWVWNDTDEEYKNTNYVYLANVSAYYTKTEADNTFAKKSANNTFTGENEFTEKVTFFDDIEIGGGDINQINGSYSTNGNVEAQSITIDGENLEDLFADKSDTYSKTEVDGKLALKADKSDTYTKMETDGKLALKADKTTAITHTGNQLQDYSGNNIYPALEPIIITNNQDWTLTNDSGWVPLANTRRFVINYGNEIPVNDTFNLSLQTYYSNNLEYTLLVEIWIVNGTTLTKVDSYTYTCPTHSSIGFYENKIIESKKNTYGYPILITVANPNGNTIKYAQSIQDNKLYNFSDLSLSTLSLSNLSFIDGYNFRYYLSYTTDVINNIKDDIDTINGKLNSYVTVKKDGTGDYTTITEALNNVPEGTPIIVYEGIYEENIKLINTAVNIRGVDKNKCIIKSKNGGYDYPTLYVKSGILKDLTIIAEYVQGTSTEIGTSNGAYAIHIESETSANTTMEIDNCILKSDFSASAGIGLRTGATFILRNSVLINNQVSGRGSYESNGGLGALYFHDSMGVEGNSKVELYNNLFISNLGSSICFYHVPNKDGNSVNMICTNNVLKDKINGYNNNIWNRNNAFDYFTIDIGYGNSNNAINED